MSSMELIGRFGVDSGQAIIGDPCYLTEWNSNYDNFDDYKEKENEFSYLGACNATLNKGYGVLGYGQAVAFSTGYGDGSYPVYAEFNDDGRIMKIVVDFN